MPTNINEKISQEIIDAEVIDYCKGIERMKLTYK